MQQKVTGNKSPNWAFMSRTVIYDLRQKDKVYLNRLRIVATPWFGVFVHRIMLPDNDRDPHDHPWNFWSFIIRGHYAEDVWEATNKVPTMATIKERKRWSFHGMRMHSAHQIFEISSDLTTLVFTGPRKRVWGFWTKDGFITWDKYEKGLGPDPFDS